MTTIERTVLRPSVNVGLAGLALACYVIVAGNFHVQPGENGGTGPALVTAVGCLVVAVALFAFVVPRVQGSQRATLYFGVAALITDLAFWSGVSLVVAAAAVAASDGVRDTPRARIGLSLAAVAALGAVVVVSATSHLF